MANNNQQTQVQVSTLKAFNGLMTDERTQNYLQQVLGEKKSQFLNNITALVANSASLQECDPQTLMFAGIKATALELPLDSNLGFAYVIPYNNEKAGKKEAQFQIGYKGFVQLAIRSGQFKTINVVDIKDGELDGEDLITGAIRFHREPNREELATIGYAAYFQLTNGFEKVFYMTKGELVAHAKRYSQTYSSRKDWVRNSSKWTTDFDAMAKKTVLKLILSKWAPLSVQMQEAHKADQAVLTEQGARYIDNQSADEQLEEMKAQEAQVVDVEEEEEANEPNKAEAPKDAKAPF